MRRVTITIACVIITYIGCAQKIDAIRVPDPVKTSFSRIYPSATNTNWEIEKGNYEVEFLNVGSRMASVFRADGTIVETEVNIKVNELPSKSLAYIKAQYKGKQIKEAAKITKANARINFEAEVDGKDLIFDESGNFLQVEPE